MERIRRSSVMANIVRGVIVLTLAFACVRSAWSYDPNGMKGTCINDVGRGAMLWGASNEVTTYSSPYMPFKTPNIYRIPLTSETTNTSPSAPKTPPGISQEDWQSKLREVGTILGTDGKLYEYYFVEGVEPRRIVETRRVRETPEGGVAPVWMTKNFERIEMEPVLIRVLRPIGTSAKIAAELAKSRAALDAPNPCDQVGGVEKQTFADEPSANAGASAGTATSPQNNSNDATPPVEGSRQDQATVPPANAAQDAAETKVEPDGTIHVFTPDRIEGVAKPILVLPKELDKRGVSGVGAIRTR